MSAFEFISHESFPEDQYISEAVTFCLDDKHRVVYIRKKMQNGGRFWDVINASVKKNGEKKYLKAYSQDSNFLREDIMKFLEKRSWEKKGTSFAQKDDQLPF